MEWGEDGMTISKMNMKEFSVVSVPANPEALATAKSLNGNQQAELRALGNKYARTMLAKMNGNTELLDNINVLETLVTTLKEVAIGEPHEVAVSEQSNRRVVLRQAQAVDQQVETVIRQIKLKGNSKNE